jgi:hypothetical protein
LANTTGIEVQPQDLELVGKNYTSFIEESEKI